MNAKDGNLLVHCVRRVDQGAKRVDLRRYRLNKEDWKRPALQYFEDELGAKAACHATAVASAQASDLLRNPSILQEVCKYLIGHSLYVSLSARPGNAATN
jgi:hypothetical protein